MANDFHNIHDKFVRESFSDPERAVAFFEIMLPEDLCAQLDMKTLKCLQESYIDNELSEYFSDLIFEVSLADDSELKTDVVLLFEHKSSPDKHVLIQVGYYLFAHYFKSVRQGKKPKAIIPIIYYQGTKKWKAPQIWELFEGHPDIIKEYMPRLNHIFIALNTISDEALLSIKNALMATAAIAQKWRFNPIKLADDLKRILALFEDREYDWNFFKMTFVYIMNASEMKIEEVNEVLKAVPPKIKDNIMTTYALIKQEGKIEGKIEKQTEVVLKSHENGISISLISNITNLSEEKVVEILKKHGREI